MGAIDKGKKRGFQLIYGGGGGFEGPISRMGYSGHMGGVSPKQWFILAVCKTVLLGSLIYFVFG